MAKHLVVCGHGAGDPGANGNGYYEASFTRDKLKPLIEKYAKQLKSNTIEFYNTGRNMYADTNAGGGAYSLSGYASVTELHLDANASSGPTGGHVIVSSKFSADKNDLAIAAVIKKYIGWWGSVVPKSGISYRADLLNLNVCANRGINYRLIELGFISNPNDVSKLINNLDAIAKEMVEAVTSEKLSGQGSGSTPAPAPNPTPADSKNGIAIDNVSKDQATKMVQRIQSKYAWTLLRDQVKAVKQKDGRYCLTIKTGKGNRLNSSVNRLKQELKSYHPGYMQQNIAIVDGDKASARIEARNMSADFSGHMRGFLKDILLDGQTYAEKNSYGTYDVRVKGEGFNNTDAPIVLNEIKEMGKAKDVKINPAHIKGFKY